MPDIRHYRFPDSAKQEFIAYVESLGCKADPYGEPLSSPYQNFPDLPYAFAAKLMEALEKILPSSRDAYESAQGILNEWAAQRRGEGSGAYIIDNMPVDKELPDTPQLAEEEPVNHKGTFVSEAAMLGAAIAEGTQPYSQTGMQGGAWITQVIPKPGIDPQEQTNVGRGTLALHTEISSNPDEETPKRQSLLGLRGGTQDHVPVGQRLFTTIVPIEQVLRKLNKDDIALLRQELFHFISGKAINNAHITRRDGPILTTNARGKTEMRFHADASPDRIRVTVRQARNPGDSQEKEQLASAETVLKKLRAACDVTQDPALNSSVVEITPGRFLSWNNREFLHGRASVGLLLENALNEEQAPSITEHPSLDVIRQVFPDRSITELVQEFNRTKLADGQLTAPDGKTRWVQRMRGNEPDATTAAAIEKITSHR